MPDRPTEGGSEGNVATEVVGRSCFQKSEKSGTSRWISRIKRWNLSSSVAAPTRSSYLVTTLNALCLMKRYNISVGIAKASFLGFWRSGPERARVAHTAFNVTG